MRALRTKPAAMPELPEVETICRGLRSVLPGRKVVQVEVREARLRSKLDGRFSSQLLGKTITNVGRRGKYLLCFLEGGWVWVCHLGMSGKLILVESSRSREKHDHIIVRLDGNHELRYHDPRRFGLSLVVSDGQFESLPQIRNLGLDPFDVGFNGDYLYSLTRISERRVRDLLIDQNRIAGLGNIYANELLFRARIRPTKRAWRLRRHEAERIAAITPKLLSEAIRW